MTSTWIVVANASRARFFERHSPVDKLTTLKELVHPESRMRQDELQTGAHGSVLNSDRGVTGISPNTYGPTTEPGDQELDAFAREIAGELDDAVRGNAVSRLIVYASPQMLGALRKRVHEGTSARIAYEEALDITRETEAQIRARAVEAVPGG